MFQVRVLQQEEEILVDLRKSKEAGVSETVKRRSLVGDGAVRPTSPLPQAGCWCRARAFLPSVTFFPPHCTAEGPSTRPLCLPGLPPHRNIRSTSLPLSPDHVHLLLPKPFPGRPSLTPGQTVRPRKCSEPPSHLGQARILVTFVILLSLGQPGDALFTTHGTCVPVP